MGRGQSVAQHQVSRRGSVFDWDRDDSNLEQIRPFLQEFEGIKQQLIADGQFPYNDLFKGRIEGVAGSEREDTAIYLLQKLSREEERQGKLTALRDQGFDDAGSRKPGEYEYRGYGGDHHQERFAVVVISNEHGTSRYESARLIWSRKLDGQPYVVLPKGKRTRGRLIETGSTVLVKQ